VYSATFSLSVCVVPHLLQTEVGFEDFKQLYMPNAPDQILSLSQLVERLSVTFPAISTEKLAHYLVQETDHRGSG